MSEDVHPGQGCLGILLVLSAAALLVVAGWALCRLALMLVGG